MTLATHAVAGAAVASFTPAHPLIGFCAGFVSHFALDAVPHWNYRVRSASLDPTRGGPITFNGDLLIDAIAIFIDGGIGIALVVVLFFNPLALPAILAGALGGLLPDFLHFVHTRLPNMGLKAFTRLHIRIQQEIFHERPLIGLLTQAGWIAGLVIAFFIIKVGLLHP
ncbi:MAG: hypothetical protein KGJ34_01460 [Patescibacteria group bacterium]|nr:hypothetical protein [Patescibacteria group bacterium]